MKREQEMTSSGSKKKSQSEEYPLFLRYCFIIVLPFILLYWMVPFLSDLTLGADYQLFSIHEQIEFLFSIKTGSFPLYAPGFPFGHSSSALTLGQVYHPISHIASLLPGYWNGKALEWNTFLRLLTLGLTHLALFSFLRQIRLTALFAFILSFITTYNIRMLEAFRYGASLEAFTGSLLLCAMIGGYYVKKSKWLGPLSIIIMTYLLLCSGHPPMMFYGFVAVVLFTMVTPFLLPVMLTDRDVSIKNSLNFWAKVGLFICIGILLSSAYLIPLKFEFVSNNISYAMSTGLVDADPPETFVGVLNNFFLPFYADLLGSFGGSSLIIIALLLPLLSFFKVKIPYAVWFLWGILLYALFYILGPGTPVYVLSYKYIPFVSSIGGVGRIAMILPSILMLLMAWIINAEAFSVHLRGISITLTPRSLLGLLALALTPVYLLSIFLLKPSFGVFTPHFVRHIPFWVEIISVLLGLLSLVLLAVYNMYPRLIRIIGILLCIITIFQIGTVLKYGIWIQEKTDQPTFEQLKAKKQENLGYAYSISQEERDAHRVVINHLSHSFMEPFLGRIFTQVIPVANQDDAYSHMQKERLPQQIFVEEFDLEKAKKLTDNAKDMDNGTVELVYSSFNRLQFRLNSKAPALFGISYPYTGHWSAWVNGEKVNVYRGNGVAHTLEIPKGVNLVEFRYWSNAFFWGVLLSCMTFTMIGLYVCSHAFGGYLRVICSALIVVIGTGGFLLWYKSLYTGDNLNTKYRWTYTSVQSPVNIAYGKKTSGYSPPSNNDLRMHSSRAVDGDIRHGSGFPLGITDDKVLIVDLNQNEKIKSIVLYGEITANPELYLSQDGIEWENIASNRLGNNTNNPLHIIFEEPRVERYIKIKSSEAKLYIDELEVYRNL